jgi:hypothetical protein
MDLTPGEKAVLGQIRVLYCVAAARNHPLKALMMQWPPTHHEAYQKSYVGLLARQLIEPAGVQRPTFPQTQTRSGILSRFLTGLLGPTTPTSRRL